MPRSMRPSRLLDAVLGPLLMAAGVTLLATGLLSYGAPALGGIGSIPSAPPTRTIAPIAGNPAPELTPPPSIDPPSQSPTPAASPTPSLEPGATRPPATPTPEPTPSPEPDTPVATRVVFPSTGIDLPIISRLQRVRGQGPDRYPPCDVALFHDAFEQPADEGATYIYGHAQEGMFLPLLEASLRRDGESMLGALVEVYTDDNRLYVYEVDRVKRHALDFSIALDVPEGEHRLVLQTSEGPLGTVPKLQVSASLISEIAADPQEAHPRTRPRACFGG